MNYIISDYICEFMNTITGFIYIYHAYKLYTALRILHGKKYNLSNYNSLSILQKNHINISIITFFIGLFTIYFHGTLTYTGQILDEYSIYLLIMILDYGYYDHIFIRMIFGFIGLNIISEYNRFFLLLYGGNRSISLFQNYKKEQNRMKKNIFIYGTLLFILSIICWITDLVYCDKLIISIHWLWHILSSCSLYYISNFSILTQVGKMDLIPSSYESYLSFVHRSLLFHYH